MPTVKMGSGEECFNFKLLEDPAGRTRRRSPPQVESKSLQNINLVDIFRKHVRPVIIYTAFLSSWLQGKQIPLLKQLQISNILL